MGDLNLTTYAGKGGTLTKEEMDQNFVRTQDAVNALIRCGRLPFSFPTNQYDSDFMIIATAIVRPTNTTPTHGQSITWEILGGSNNHGSSFITGVQGAVTGYLEILYPTVKNVFYCSANPDESFAAYLTIQGATVSTTKASFFVGRNKIAGQRLRGNGTDTWQKLDAATGNNYLDLSKFNTSDGSTGFSIQNVFWPDPGAMAITYIGPNRYTIKRVYSGLGPWGYKFIILKPDGSPLDSYPTEEDEIVVSPLGVTASPIGMNTYSSATNLWMTGFFNFWVLGIFEAWMVALPMSDSEILVKWQPEWPSASSYKLYRDTSSSFSNPTLIHTGTEGVFFDTLLTANTNYHYKLVAVVGGVDTDVTTFRCRTKKA